MAGGTGVPSLDLQQKMVAEGSVKCSVTSLASGTVTTVVTTPLAGRCRLYVTTSNTVNVYVGNSSVLATNGFPLVQNSPLPFPITDAIPLYAVADGATSIRILEMA